MRKSKFTESQIVAILKEGEPGVPVAEVCRKHGISSPTYFAWKSTYAGATVSDLTRMHDAGVHDLPATRDQTVLLQLLAQCLEDGLAALATLGQSRAKRPQRAGIGDVQCAVEAAEALEAQPVEHLVLALLIGEVVQALQEDHAHQHLGGVRRAPTLAAVEPRARSIHRSSHLREVDQLVHRRETLHVALELGLALAH